MRVNSINNGPQNYAKSPNFTAIYRTEFYVKTLGQYLRVVEEKPVNTLQRQLVLALNKNHDMDAINKLSSYGASRTKLPIGDRLALFFRNNDLDYRNAPITYAPQVRANGEDSYIFTGVSATKAKDKATGIRYANRCKKNEPYEFSDDDVSYAKQDYMMKIKGMISSVKPKVLRLYYDTVGNGRKGKTTLVDARFSAE